MSSLASPPIAPPLLARATAAPAVDVVVPVFDEAAGVVQRRAVRLQGRAHGRDPRAAAAGPRRRLFFDTELLVLAQRRGLRIHEVPVDWVDDPDSRVRIVATALADLRGVARLLLPGGGRGRSERADTPSASAVHPDRACA